MTTIGTITFHNSTNYGAILQAYALQKVLADMGHAPEIIDYCDRDFALGEFSRYRRIRHSAWRGLLARSPFGRRRAERTTFFREKYLRRSPHKYLDAKSLRAAPPLYDVYITGSDQVWNPRINNNDPSWFLDFAPPKKRRVSYAASFGVSQIEDRFIADYRTRLAAIDCLSCREFAGRDIIKTLTGRDATVVLDPTLLLDGRQWRNVAIPYESANPYVLCYYLPGDRVVTQNITGLGQKVAKRIGARCVHIGEKEYAWLWRGRQAVLDAGPAEFLGLLLGASVIVTNSFHGTAFAVIHRKPFLVPVNQQLPAEKTLTSRIATLLDGLGLRQRMVAAANDLPPCAAMETDYRDVECRLAEMKKVSLRFLTSAVSGL